MENKNNRIKINIPANQKDYINGSGEECWVLITPDILKYYKSNIVEMQFTAILDNDSVYYPSLKKGTSLLCEMRGSYRPVANYEAIRTKRVDILEIIENALK